MPDQPRATRPSKRERVYRDENVEYPWDHDPQNPDLWCGKPREHYEAPFHPDRVPGTKGLNISSFDAPGKIFCTIMNECLNLMSEETNRYGSQRSERGEVDYKWTDVDPPEMVAFISILLAQGACVKKDYQSHWTDKGLNSTPGYAQVMTLRRFKQIKQNMHFVNNDEAMLIGFADKDDPRYEPLYKILEFLSCAYRNFREARAPGKQLSFDEQMVRFCGRLGFRVKMPCKPIKEGIKLYLLTDSVTGYPLACVVHAGEYADDTGTLTLQKVWAGLAEANVFDQGHVVYMDSYYTSLALVEACFERDVYVVGMMKPNMAAGLPPVITDRKSKFSKSMKKGEAVFLHTNKYTVCNWSDSANAIMLQSLPDVTDQWTTCVRRVKKPGGGHESVVRPQPVSFNLYNKYMGGQQQPEINTEIELRLTDQRHLMEPCKRRLCKGHKQAKWTTVMCSTCNVPLCKTCFKRYHTLADYVYDDPKKVGANREYGKKKKK